MKHNAPQSRTSSVWITNIAAVQNKPSLTVVIPCWNGEKWVARAIQSALDQRFPNLSVVVVDDGSTDGSLDVIRAFDRSIVWESGPNKGACAARNRGLTLTSSTYVLFLDADDYLEGNILEGLAEAVETSADIIFAPAFKEFETGYRECRTIPQIVDPKLVALSWIRGDYVPPGSVLWRRRFLEQLGGWNANVARNQDGELMLRALFSSPRIAYTGKGCSVYVNHDSPDRVSSRKTHEALRSALDVLCHAQSRIAELGWIDVEFARALHAALYGIALQCFEEREFLLGRRAVSEMRTLGVRGHYGSWKNQIAVALIGLEYTGRLKPFWRSFSNPFRHRSKGHRCT